MKMLSCPLTQPAVAVENTPNTVAESSNSASGIKICVQATIGLGYNGSLLLSSFWYGIHADDIRRVFYSGSHAVTYLPNTSNG